MFAANGASLLGAPGSDSPSHDPASQMIASSGAPAFFPNMDAIMAAAKVQNNPSATHEFLTQMNNAALEAYRQNSSPASKSKREYGEIAAS